MINNNIITNKILFILIQVFSGIMLATLYIFLRIYIINSSKIVYRRKRPWYLKQPDYVIPYIVSIIFSVILINSINESFSKKEINRNIYKIIKIGNQQIRFSIINYLIIKQKDKNITHKLYIGNNKYKLGQEITIVTKKGYLGFDFMKLQDDLNNKNQKE